MTASVLPLTGLGTERASSLLAGGRQEASDVDATARGRRCGSADAFAVYGMDAVSRELNFDPLARPYRWLEYATFGRALERCRFHFLPALTGARRALVLGDGDGRFLARLLRANPELEADVVDCSPAMLRLLQRTAQARRPTACLPFIKRMPANLLRPGRITTLSRPISSSIASFNRN